MDNANALSSGSDIGSYSESDSESRCGSDFRQINKSLCDVCRGLVDLKSPRGFILDSCNVLDSLGNLDPHYGRYVFTYIHHANLEILLATANAGCWFCKTIVGSIWEYSNTSLEKHIAERSLDQGSAQPNSAPHPVEPDQDMMAATELAELAKRGGLYRTEDLEAHGPGRIIVQSYFPTKFDRPGNNGYALYETHTLTRGALDGLFHYFTSPCMSQCKGDMLSSKASH